MPRFGVAFNRRKSTATSEDFQHGQVVPEQPSFRVIERNDPAVNRSFDGGARMARATGGHVPRPSHQLELDVEDNMFSDLKSGNRGSGASNTTKATSTDTSSRHSAASTAPSSADLDDSKHTGKKNLHDVSSRAAPKSSGSGFLNRAGRTFSFGVQKKHNTPAPSNDPIPDVPPIPTIQHQDFTGRPRGMTDSTTSTATPPKLEENGNMDLGGDFGSMFSSFDKRASMATLKQLEGSTAPRSLTGNRPVQPAPLSINKSANVEPAPASWNSGRNSGDNLLGSAPTSPNPDHDLPPPVPRHQSSFKTNSRPSDIIEDEDAKLLQDSITVGRMLSDSGPSSNSYSNSQSRFQQDEDTFDTSFSRKPLGSSFKKGDDNLFEGTLAHSSRLANRWTARAPSPPRNKVMTPAQFEKYRKDKERQGVAEPTHQPTISNDDDEDEINYDDDDDEVEKSKEQAKQRKKQEAHMAVYRQQMMKVTGEQPEMNHIDRPSLPNSMSAPQLHLMKKTPSPGPTGISDEDSDEEVPLAILQAHGFPGKNRPPTRLSTMGSNSNLRGAAQLQPPRPGSAMGDGSSNNQNQRHSILPAFARNLPQDPFVGASINRPAIRESLSFAGGAPPQQQPQQGGVPPGGLVGVIASEERSRAMRRGGSPNLIEGQKLMPGMNGPQGGFDAMGGMGGVPPHMMYGMGGPGGMQGMQGMPGMPQMPQMPQQSLTVGDQAQLQMTQQMSQFMQMQMQFMQMMAGGNQPQNPGMQQPQMQQPYGGLAATQSMNDLSSRHSMMFEPTMEPPRLMDPGVRTMSMVQPSSGSYVQQPGYAGSIMGTGMGGMGYTPSIAPSERSNVGLPGRYRPVSQLNPMIPDTHRRTNTMSGALGRWDENKPKATINIVKPGDGSDEDDDEGWEAMKAKRDKKRTLWKSKKGLGSELSAMI